MNDPVTSEEMKLCKYCQSSIPRKAKICPNCRKKQGRKKLPLLIAAAVLLLIIVIATSGGSSSTTPTDRKSASDSSTAAASQGPLQIYELLQNNEVVPYTLNEKARSFLTEHENLFPASGEIDNSLVDYSLDYRQILKNPSKYGDTMIYLPYLSVVQITEEDIGGKYFTELNTIDENRQQYYILYCGELSSVFADTVISAYGLPLGSSQFDNTDGGQTIVIMLAGALISTIGD